MKNLFVWFLLATLVFTAACGKQPQNPVTPTEPAPPATEMPTEAPTQPVTEAPTEPVTEAPTEADLSGKVAVLTADAPLENASAETVDANGNRILMDMELTLSRGTLVYVETQEQDLCTVVLLAGEPPHPRGQLPAELLRTEVEDLLQARQVILNDTPVYATAGDADFKEKRSGVAQVEARNAQWWKVSLPGGGEPFWVRQTDLTWEWPLPEHDEPVSEPEPDGAVAAVMLPGNVIPDLGRLEQWMPLEGNALALLATREEQTRVLIFDMMEQTVLADCQVPAYGKNGSTRQLSILENDPRTLLYYDGRDYWKLAADDRWQLTAEEYDILQQSTEMGSHTVEQTKGGIAVDGVVPDGLKSDNNRVCTLAAIVDDHRLLYQYNGYTVSAMMDRYVGVYDHSTGQTRPLTTAGQQAWGVWGNTLLLVRGGGPVYDMGWVDLTDYTYTPLDIGHQTTADAVDAALCNAAGTRLMVSWNDADGDHVQVFDLESGEVLYQWSAPQKNGWSFYPVDDNGLVVTRHADGAFPIWKVEY